MLSSPESGHTSRANDFDTGMAGGACWRELLLSDHGSFQRVGMSQACHEALSPVRLERVLRSRWIAGCAMKGAVNVGLPLFHLAELRRPRAWCTQILCPCLVQKPLFPGCSPVLSHRQVRGGISCILCTAAVTSSPSLEYKWPSGGIVSF